MSLNANRIILPRWVIHHCGGCAALLLLGAAAAQNPRCSGSDCLVITDVRHGTRCGTSDSIETDIQNASGSMYLRGYVVFETPKGPQRVATGLMKPGEKGNSYTCHGAGKPTVLAETSLDSAHLSYPGSPSRKTRPDITGIRLDKPSLDLLKHESEKLRLAGYTKDLLAWSPLIGLIGENSAPHAAVSILQSNWEELANSFSAVDKTVFYSLATDARIFANSDATFGNHQLKQFWNAMADFYAAQADGR